MPPLALRRSVPPRRPTTAPAVVVLLLGAALLLAPAPTALGRFVDAAAPTVVATVDRLDPPAGVTCTGGLVICNATLLTRPQLTWTPTVDAYADGYRILRSTTSGSGYVEVATAPGRLITTWTDNGSLSPLTTYYYVVVSTAGSWRSTASTEVAITIVLP